MPHTQSNQRTSYICLLTGGKAVIRVRAFHLALPEVWELRGTKFIHFVEELHRLQHFIPTWTTFISCSWRGATLSQPPHCFTYTALIPSMTPCTSSTPYLSCMKTAEETLRVRKNCCFGFYFLKIFFHLGLCFFYKSELGVNMYDLTEDHIWYTRGFFNQRAVITMNKCVFGLILNSCFF